MKASLQAKLEQLLERFDELSALLADPGVIGEQDQFRRYSQEYAELEPVVRAYDAYRSALGDQAAAQAMLADSDAEMRALGEEELAAVETRLESLAGELQALLLPRDPDDRKSVFLEIRAGTGGDEAALFAGDLFRMYSRYAESRGWRIEMISASEGEQGGFREVISRVTGDGVYGDLKFESGAHRVQRVPATESQGRIHTSACTVAVLPEADAAEAVDIRKEDLRIDTYRSSGAGGQHVNTTDSAIRITHLPTGLVVECQEERSQHKNRAKAMALLASRLEQAQKDSAQQQQASERRLLVGSGDRSERIRTYNFPQGRVTDHRINLTLYKLDEVMSGQLGDIIQPLLTEHQADLLAELGQGAA